MSKSILVIDDDIEMRKLLRQVLEVEGYEVNLESNAESALREISSKQPDLIILDLVFPNTDGLDICRQLKNDLQTAQIPILILSSRQDEIDIVAGLKLGAEDYITKPFSPLMLLTRVDTILRRNRKGDSSEQSIVFYEDFIIDPQRFEIRHLGKSITVTRSEFRILHCLFSQSGIVFTRKQILEAIHGHETPVTIRSIDVMIVNLRQKLGTKGKLIETVRGVGYRAKEVEQEVKIATTPTHKEDTRKAL